MNSQGRRLLVPNPEILTGRNQHYHNRTDALCNPSTGYKLGSNIDIVLDVSEHV